MLNAKGLRLLKHTYSPTLALVSEVAHGSLVFGLNRNIRNNTFRDLVALEFNDPVNTIKVMLSRPVC